MAIHNAVAETRGPIGATVAVESHIPNWRMPASNNRRVSSGTCGEVGSGHHSEHHRNLVVHVEDRVVVERDGLRQLVAVEVQVLRLAHVLEPVVEHRVVIGAA